MFCKKCGTDMGSGKICPNCGYEVVTPQNTGSVSTVATQDVSSVPATKPVVQEPASKSKKLSVWCWLSIASLLCSFFTLFKGIHKLTQYDSGENYPYKLVNAYVGGDAYNYIINGTHATAFFVLTAMFVLAAIGLMMLHYISKK